MMRTLDGYLRLPLVKLLSSRLTHVLSGLDDEPDRALADCGCPTSVTGYTEWASTSAPIVSLGWDWKLEVRSDQVVFVRTGFPRSNIMLVDSTSVDYGYQRTQEALATVVDALHWRKYTRTAIEQRYANFGTYTKG